MRMESLMAPPGVRLSVVVLDRLHGDDAVVWATGGSP